MTNAKTEAEHAAAMLNQPMDEITRIAVWRVLSKTPYSGMVSHELTKLYGDAGRRGTQRATLADALETLERINDAAKRGSEERARARAEYEALSQDVRALRRVFGLPPSGTLAAMPFPGASDNG